MRSRRATMWLAGGAVAALALTACGGSDSGGGTSSGSAAGTVTVNGSEPQNPLVPTNTNETGGGNVIDNVFTGLVTYNPKTAKPENAVAKEITSSDQITWNIKLNEG
ncbi:MAG: oligopeptide transport system substrate-binding protein, partial [Actinomycetota bacterium]|nr:oligopeptide transport system substrate-binding protein [Actinomycetota bacterium]